MKFPSENNKYLVRTMYSQKKNYLFIYFSINFMHNLNVYSEIKHTNITKALQCFCFEKKKEDTNFGFD